MLDTGPLVALYNSNDDWHKRCKDFFGEEERFNYLLTQAVIGEVIYHIQKGKSNKAASKAVVSFLEDIESGLFAVHELSEDYITRMKTIRSQYLDQKLDFADISLVLAAEDRQISEVVTIDLKDFGYLKYKFVSKKTKTLKPFRVIAPELES